MSVTKSLFIRLAVLATLILPAITNAQVSKLGRPIIKPPLKHLLAPWNPEETVLYAGATVHTVSGQTLSPGFVLVENGKIKQVGTNADSEVKQTREIPRIDLKGLHLYPGMIALNTTLGLVEIGAIRATHDETEVGEYTPEVQSWVAVNPDSELLPVARANGVAYFEPVPQGGIVGGQSGLVALEGWTSEQMTVKKPMALHLFWPAADLDTTPKERSRNKEKWKSLEDQAKERREKLKELDDFFAEARAYAKAGEVAGKSQSATFRRVPAWEAMLPVVRGEIPITVHADDVRQIRAAVKWAGTNQYKIILAEARDAWKVAGLLASNNIPVIYNHVFSQPVRDSDAYDVHFTAPAVLQKAGVKVVFGLSSYRDSLVKNLPYDAAQAVAFGLPPDEALKGITLYPAQVAGVAERLASVIVVVPAKRSPIKAIALFLQKVAKAAGAKPELILLLVGRKAEAGFAPVDKEDFTYWKNFTAINGLHVSLEKWSPA